MSIDDWDAIIPRHDFNETVKELEKAKRALYKTLRDEFAMAALVGLLNGNYVELGGIEIKNAEAMAKVSYGVADAMLAERNK